MRDGLSKMPRVYDAEAVGKRMRTIRTMLGLSQKDFAKFLGVAPQQVNQYEQGSSRPSFAVALYLKTTYGVTFDWLYAGDATHLTVGLAHRLAEVEKSL